ncbi:MAG: M28 family peptidase [Bacteroidota bacterium]
MRQYFIGLLIILITSVNALAQDTDLTPEFDLAKAELESHLRFLASDEMQGRKTGELTNQIAARYIAEQLRSYGVQRAADLPDYYQQVPFVRSYPADAAYLKVNDLKFELGSNLVVLGGQGAEVSAKAVFANYGWVDEETGYNDYEKLDVKGKIVFVLSGRPDTNNPYEIFASMSAKPRIAAERGAIAMVEVYKLNFPWRFFVQNFNKPGMNVASNPEDPLGDQIKIPYLWIDPGTSGIVETLQDKKSKKLEFELASTGTNKELVPSQNVIGVVEGSDPELKNEYVLLSAHYDHVGTGSGANGGAVTETDTIFNGARDNGIGTVALIAAAKTLAQAPPKRSVIILAVTGEEMGLLGSRFYASNPVIPLKQTIFNLNTDGAGYNDKTKVSIMGFDRVGAAAEMEKAASTFGLGVIADPAPEQNLFDRSDNVSFAQKGIPAPTFSPGFTAFDEVIAKHYHQVSDNPDTVDYDYVLRYAQAFAMAARLIADKDERPQWKEGDKYEAAGKTLYGK